MNLFPKHLICYWVSLYHSQLHIHPHKDVFEVFLIYWFEYVFSEPQIPMLSLLLHKHKEGKGDLRWMWVHACLNIWFCVGGLFSLSGHWTIRASFKKVNIMMKTKSLNCNPFSAEDRGVERRRSKEKNFYWWMSKWGSFVSKCVVFTSSSVGLCSLSIERKEFQVVLVPGFAIMTRFWTLCKSRVH